MSENAVLVSAVTCAFPYLTVCIVLIVKRWGEWTPVGLGVCLLIGWPACVFGSLSQLVVVVPLCLWWWCGDFSDPAKRALSFRRPLPTGLVAMVAGTVVVLYVSVAIVACRVPLPFGLK